MNTNDYLLPLKVFRAGEEGNLSVLDEPSLPFLPARIFFVYDVGKGTKRGSHAHKKCKQLLTVIKGSVEVLIDNGINQKIFTLEGPEYSLYLPEYTWSHQITKSSFSTICVLASTPFDIKDYIFDYDEFKSQIS
jgi:UDP-2-acetamido-3-amino-2,3-dideoxy-glucuronate N-acetyltransferase